MVNPFFHTFGFKAGILACLVSGAALVPQPVFDAGEAMRLVEAERITVLPEVVSATAGRAAAGFEVKIARSDEILLRGPNLMLGPRNARGSEVTEAAG